MNTQMHKINSSQIDSIGWDSDRLTVKFKSGSVYLYTNVPESLYNEMMNAPKPSAVFQERIKRNPGLYPYRKLAQGE